MEDTLKQLIIDTLHIECDCTFDILPNPCAVYDFYRVDSEQFGNGRIEKESVAVQVDLYYQYKNPRDEAANKLHEAFKQQKYYTYPSMSIYYDEIAEKYRATYKFNVLKG